ncbi:uncharacterized protein LOC118212589 isoform X6 [Anguilla anguilla]|uniref:uncharacterized protein LOC118212589 isoform X6 n=1 Tax=Anguilla anguilla TaxID=7936 RepID=UPI0015AF7EC9|nr:uncharacterized protein LOC118212589 isoform X6 [Anguilla anguilla]
MERDGPPPAGLAGLSAQDVWMCLDMRMLEEELDSILRSTEEASGDPRGSRRAGQVSGGRDSARAGPPAPPSETGNRRAPPDTPAEIRTPGTDVSSADELDSARWSAQELSWMLNPLSLQQLSPDPPAQGADRGILPPKSAPEQGLGSTANQECDWPGPDEEGFGTQIQEVVGHAREPKGYTGTDWQLGELREATDDDRLEARAERPAGGTSTAESTAAAASTVTAGTGPVSVETRSEDSADGSVYSCCVHQTYEGTQPHGAGGTAAPPGGSEAESSYSHGPGATKEEEQRPHPSLNFPTGIWALHSAPQEGGEGHWREVASLGQEEVEEEEEEKEALASLHLCPVTEIQKEMEQTWPTESEEEELKRLLEELEEFSHLDERFRQPARLEQLEQPERSVESEQLEQPERSVESEQLEQPEWPVELEEIEESEQVQQPEQLEQLEEFEQAVQSEQLEQTVQSWQYELAVQLEQLEQTVQFEQSEKTVQSEQTVQLEQTVQSEQLDQTVQFEQLEQTVQSEQLDQTVQLEQLEQTVQSEKLEQTVQSEELEQTVQFEQLDQTVQLEQLDQTVQSEQLDQTVQSEKLEQTVQLEQLEQTVQSEKLEQTVQSEKLEQTVQLEQLEQTVQLEQLEQTVQFQQLEQAVQSEQLKQTVQLVQTVQLEQLEQTVQLEQLEQTVQVEQLEQTVQLEQLEQTVQLEQIVQLEHLEQTVQLEQLEQTVQFEQLEQTVQVERLEQTVQPDQLEQTVQPERLEQTVQSEQLEQTVQVEQLEQTVQVEQLEQTVQPDRLEQTVQPERLEQTVQVEQLEQTVQPERLEQTVQVEQLEPTVQPERLEQTVQPEQLEQTVQVEQLEQTVQVERLEQTVQVERLEQTVQVKQLEQTVQVKQLEQTVQVERLEQTVQVEQLEQTVQVERLEQTVQVKQLEQTVQVKQLEQTVQVERLVQTVQPEPEEDLEQSSEQGVHRRGNSGQREQTQQRLQPEQTQQPLQPEQTQQRLQPEQTQQRLQPEQTQQPLQPEQTQQPLQPEQTQQPLQPEQTQQVRPTDPAQACPPQVKENGVGVDREGARRLAERLHKLQDVRRTEVVAHMDKDNEFSRAVGQEYLKLFDFTGQTLEQALRSFLKVVVLIGESQERERVLQHFAERFHDCNPDGFSSSGAVLTLTCALMLLNTDLHGQNVGKPMSLSSFVSNLEGMNDGENFHRETLKVLYSSIKSEALQWAIDEEELKAAALLPGDAKADAPAGSRINPFQDVQHDEAAPVFKEGFLTRKAHADVDGKRTPWGKRGWKTFYAVLKGLVLYLMKDQNGGDWRSAEEVVSVHHSLAEPVRSYTKRPHVFRLQTADWRVYLLQAASAEQVSSWLSRVNLVSALYSSPPFPAAVGSQRRFSRPILPAKASPLTLEQKLQSHSRMLESFSEDLRLLQEELPNGRRAKPRELEEHRLREEYLQHEKTRYEVYLQVLEVWQALGGEVGDPVGADELELFDREVRTDTGEEQPEAVLKKSYSSPSLVQAMAPPTEVKVKRNISERRSHRKVIVPRRSKDV